MNAHLFALGISDQWIAARGLRHCEEATDLQCAEIGADGRDHLLVPAAANAWRMLRAAAFKDGIALFIVSAFRSMERQAEFDQTPAYAWLTERAAEFGYHLSYPVGNPWGYQYEPWHWCFHDAR